MNEAIFDFIQYDIMTILTNIIGVILCAKKMEKKNNYYLKLSLLIIGLFVFEILFELLLFLINKTQLYSFIKPFKYILLFSLITLLVSVCYKTNFYGYLFCSTTAYCLEHISTRLMMMIRISFDLNLNFFIDKFIQIIITSCVICFFYFLFIKKSQFYNYNDNISSNWPLLAVSLILILINMCLSSLVNNEAYKTGNILIRNGIYIYSLCCASLLIILLSMTVSKNETTNKLLQVENNLNKFKKNYENERKNYEYLSTKVHDLKYLLQENISLDNNEKEKLTSVINDFSSSIHTGNNALDIAINKYQTICKQNNISFKCIIDGNIFSKMQDYEIFTLFSNALDNALRATKNNKNTRFINIDQQINGSFVNIRILNTYDGETLKLNSDTNLPNTTKEDKRGHGIGILSMKQILEKYNGTLSIKNKDNIFILSFILPLDSESA